MTQIGVLQSFQSEVVFCVFWALGLAKCGKNWLLNSIFLSRGFFKLLRGTEGMSLPCQAFPPSPSQRLSTLLLKSTGILKHSSVVQLLATALINCFTIMLHI